MRPQYQPESHRRAGQDAGQDRPRHRATPPGLSVSPGNPQHHRRHRGHRRRKPSAARRGLSVRDSTATDSRRAVSISETAAGICPPPIPATDSGPGHLAGICHRATLSRETRPDSRPIPPASATRAAGARGHRNRATPPGKMPPGRADSLQDTATPPATGPPLWPQYQPKATAGRGKMPGKTAPATGPPRRGCQSVRATLSTTAATGDTAAGNPQPPAGGCQSGTATATDSRHPGQPQPGKNGGPPRLNPAKKTQK